MIDSISQWQPTHNGQSHAKFMAPKLKSAWNFSLYATKADPEGGYTLYDDSLRKGIQVNSIS